MAIKDIVRTNGIRVHADGARARLKVAHITTVDLSLRYLLLNQLQRIGQAGYEVTGISAPGPDVSTVEAANIRHIPVPMTRNFTPLADLGALHHLYQVMRRERFTIVHTHTPKPGLLGQLAARMAGVPIVVNTLHGFYFHDNMASHWRRFYIATEKIAARCSDVILSQNREDIETAIAEGISPPQKIRHLGNGIDVRRFDPDRLDREMLVHKRRELGIPNDAHVIGFVGRLVAEKGILELLQAAQVVHSHVPSTRFLIVGPIDHDKPDALTPKITEKYGLAKACIFTGLRQDMPDLYALMDLFVLPSHREGFPRSPMEASAMGVPSIATDIRGCREAVAPGRNGLLVPLGHVPALTDAILELLLDRDKRGAMGETARRMALTQFDERLVFERVIETYAELLARKGILQAALSRPLVVQKDEQQEKQIWPNGISHHLATVLSNGVRQVEGDCE